ncbi:MAG TPA: hypothetical protein VFO25_12785 [Candidatus Eremiobacteraceae bacterium]|nr:hypothetical protein [Candidatus Eremiobacteraceae bacterium]
MFDYKNEINGNTGGPPASPGVCLNQNDKRDTAFLTWIRLHGTAESSASPPSTNDDVLHAKPGPTPTSAISMGDGDSGRIVGAPTDCTQSPNPDATVQKYMMNPQGIDMIGMAQDYFRGVLGSKAPYVVTGFTYISPTPAPSASNPNGSGINTCDYDTAKLGPFSCYDIFYLDQAAPHYNRGQSSITWTGSLELDPSPGPTGIWDWTNSYPGLVAAQLAFANGVLRPTGTGAGDTGAPFPVWLNGFATFNGGTRSDDSTTGATVESCNADELGQDAFGATATTAPGIVGGSIEDSWLDGSTQVPLSVNWAVNMNCTSDIHAENSPTPVFAEVGGHSTAFDTSADGYDLNTTATTAVSPNPSPQVITVGSTQLNGAPMGHDNPFALLVGGGGNQEIVSVVDSMNSPTPTITAIFTNSHSTSYVVRSLSPYSYRITTYALTLLAYVDGRTVVQMKYGSSHLDVPFYAEALIYPGSPVKTMATFLGNPVFTKIAGGIASPGPMATAIVNNAKNIQPGQTLNLFNNDKSSWEQVTVNAVNRTTNKVTFDSVAFVHGTNSILRGTQAYDGCQMVGASPQPTPDASTSGGIADYLIAGTCGEDGTALHRAGGVYCREFNALTVYAAMTMNGAACVNMTNAKVSFKSLLSSTQGGSCGSGGYCLTHAYTHVCGAINAKDDGCLGETPPVNTSGTINCASPPCMLTVTLGSVTNVYVNGSYLVDSPGTNQETVLATAVNLTLKAGPGRFQ